MSISEEKAKVGAMTPTAQIAAIRQRTEDAWTNGCTIDEATAAVFDRATLMDIWDTHQSALRALVAQWRETGKLFRTRAIAQMATRTTSGRIAADAFDASADAHFSVADALERLLESEP